MSSRVVSRAQIECDSCGKLREDLDPDATTARINAAHDHWKYVRWNIKGMGLQKRRPRQGGFLPGRFEVETVPKQWDCCPDCPLPEGPAEAAKIRDKRTEAA